MIMSINFIKASNPNGQKLQIVTKWVHLSPHQPVTTACEFTVEPQGPAPSAHSTVGRSQRFPAARQKAINKDSSTATKINENTSCGAGAKSNFKGLFSSDINHLRALE